MRCSTCHRDQPEALFRGAKRLLATCAPCREARAAARRARGVRSRVEPKIALDLPGSGSSFRARLFHADARDLLESCERPDLIVTEPPYGVDRESEEDRKDREMKLAYAVLGLAIRRLKPGGHAYVFGDARQPFLRHGLERAVRPLVEVQQPLVWDPGGTLGAGRRARREGRWEYVTIWERLPDGDAAEREALRPRPEPIRAPDPRSAGRAVTLPLLLPHAPDPTGGHATSKPVELLKQIVAVGSRIHELVLDPFAGSGSTGVAALELGRRFLGIESEELAAQSAAERIARAGWPSVDEALIEESHWAEGLGDWWAQIEPS